MFIFHLFPRWLVDKHVIAVFVSILSTSIDSHDVIFMNNTGDNCLHIYYSSHMYITWGTYIAIYMWPPRYSDYSLPDRCTVLKSYPQLYCHECQYSSDKHWPKLRCISFLNTKYPRKLYTVQAEMRMLCTSTAELPYDQLHSLWGYLSTGHVV